MHRILISSFLSTAIAVTVLLPVHSLPKAKLLQPGDFHGDEVKARSGEIWYGVAAQGGSYTLRKTKVKVTLMKDTVGDSDNQKTGKRVSTRMAGRTLFLVRDLGGLTEGPLPGFIAAAPLLQLNKPIKIRAGNLHGQLEVKGIRQDQAVKNYKVVFSTMGRSQTIYEAESQSDQAQQQLLWAGDLNRDGRLDLLIDVTNDYNASIPTLFLSSRSKGKLIKPVAKMVAVGC